MAEIIKYPIGEQSFQALREEGYLYVDKTRFIEKIVNGGKYYFLGRPRRFGKSLFLSTLKCFFQGKRELFAGLYVDSMPWEWDEYPVLHLDVNIGDYTSPEALDTLLINRLEEWERRYPVNTIAGNVETRFYNVIRAAHHHTGRKVVVLVDEYDKPLVHNLDALPQFERVREKLGALYANFKSCADHLRLVFLTGVSRFAKLSVFSGLNNLQDISFQNDYSDICGISERELRDNFKDGISALSERYGLSCEEICRELKIRYDGYRFSSEGEEIYNPFSLLQVMSCKEFGSYWVESGQAGILRRQLIRFDVNLKKLLHTRCGQEALKGYDLDNPRPVALLYQTGYLTIKSYDRANGIYTLGLPNREVEEGFLNYLLPSYANLQDDDAKVFVLEMLHEFRNGDVEGIMTRLQAMFAKVPYDMAMDREQNVHNALLILMLLIGLDVRTEYRTSQGRIDLFVCTEKFYYILELKLDGTAKEALRQIEDKRYALPFSTDGRQIIEIGVNFSRESRTITDWEVKKIY